MEWCDDFVRLFYYYAMDRSFFVFVKSVYFFPQLSIYIVHMSSEYDKNTNQIH